MPDVTFTIRIYFCFYKFLKNLYVQIFFKISAKFKLNQPKFKHDPMAYVLQGISFVTSTNEFLIVMICHYVS